jgi:hypothetical protein
MSAQQEQVAWNQATGRVANERMLVLWEQDGVTWPSEAQWFLCECGAVKCREPIKLTRAAYEAVRAYPRHFVVALEHIYREVERVIAEPDGYMVVEKSEAVSRIVTTTDPRSH